MNIDFARLITSDGLELCGLFFTPEFGVSEITVIHVHGLAGNFYENRFVDIVAEAVIDQGLNFMAFNNRGHDYISDSTHIGHDGGEIDYLQIGGAYERFEDCLLDIDAFREFARLQGSVKHVLMGHSHGALKIGHYFYRREHPDLIGGIFLSPSDDFGISREHIGDRFDEALEIAKNLVDNGNESQMMPTGYHSYPLSAGAYLDTFRDDSPLKLFNLSGTDRTDFPELETIKVPVLGIVGTVAESFVGEPREFLKKIGGKLKNAKSFEGHAIDGAPHNYMLHEDELADIIGDWLTKTYRRNI